MDTSMMMVDAASIGRADKDIGPTSTVGSKKENICFFTEAQMREAPIAHLYIHQTVIQCISVLSKNEKISIEEAAVKLGCSGEIALKLKKDMEDNEE